MQLHPYLARLSNAEREEFAAKCETTVNYLLKLARGFKTGLRPQAELAVLIETHSNQTVRRWDLIPEKWARIWPEIVGTEGAPLPWNPAANDATHQVAA